MPSFSQVIADINQKIIPNNNQEITANVLRPILIDMLSQPNELIGDISQMNIPAPHNTNVVTAVNYILSQLSGIQQFDVYFGVANPNIFSPTPTPKPFDFYAQSIANQIYIYNGTKWVLVSDNYISYSNIQSLTQTQKDLALSNIGGLAVDMANLPLNLTTNQKNIIKNKLDITDQTITISFIGNGNAITDIVQPNPNSNYLEIHKDKTFLEAHPIIPVQPDTTDSLNLDYGDTFSAANVIVRDSNGHTIRVNFRNFRLPDAQDLSAFLVDSDLNGFMYNPTYDPITHRFTADLYNGGTFVMDLPIESLISNVSLDSNNNLIITFQDGSVVTIPLNTLLVGVVKFVNGKAPNSLGEVVINITDIPGLSSELLNKLDLRMNNLANNLSVAEQNDIKNKLGWVDTDTVTRLGTTIGNLTFGDFIFQGSGATTITKVDQTFTIESTDTHDWASITGKPSTFTASPHSHQMSDIIGLSSALSSKVDLNGSNSTGALSTAISRQHDALSLGLNTGGLSLDVANQILSFVHPNSGVSAGTYNNVTVNAQGHVTSGSNVPYLTSFTETDPTVPSWVKSITQANINDWNSKQGALSNGLHTILNGNKVDVAFDVNTYVKDKSNNDRLLFGNTASTDVIIKGAVANGDFKIKDSTDTDLFRFNGSNKVAYFPQLPAPQTGDAYLAIFDSGNGLWKHSTRISDLVTVSVLNSGLATKANVNGNNLTNIPQWLTNLGVYSTTQVDGFLAGKANTNHTHYYLTDWADTRNIATIPNDYNNRFEPKGIKDRSLYGVGINYVSVFGYRGWLDNSGGNSIEFIVPDVDNTLYFRVGSTTSWGSLNQFWHTGNFDPNTKANTIGTYLGFISGDSKQWNGQNYTNVELQAEPYYFLGYDAVNNTWKPITSQYASIGLSNYLAQRDGGNLTNIPNWQSVLGITTALNLNLQQVTNNGASTTNTININGLLLNNFEIRNNTPIQFYTINGFVQKIYTGGILASDNYADASLIPANGIYSKGDVDFKNLFFNDRSQPLGIYFAPTSSGGLFIGKHNNRSWTGDLGFIEYNGTFQWNGTIHTGSHGTSADWNAKVSQSQLGNYVDLTTQNQIVNSNKVFLTQGNTFLTKGLELRGNGSTFYPGISFHQPGVDASILEMRNDSLLYWYNEPLASRNWVNNNFASNATLGNYVNKAGDTMSGSIDFNANNIGLYFNGWKALEGYINNTILSANGASIYFRPNGSNSSTGQVYIDIDGTVSISNATAPNHAVAFGQLGNYALISQIPTNNNQLANGSNYITSAALAGYALISQIPTDNAQLSNGAGYITAASLPTVNNALLTFAVNASHFSSGAFNFSANQSTNVSPTLALSNSILTDIGLGLTAYNSLGNYIPTNRFITINGQTQFLNNNPNFTISATPNVTVEALPPQGGGNIPIKMNKTRVSVEAGTGYQIDDGNFEGDELVIVPCGSSFDIVIDMRWMDYCMNVYPSLGFVDLKPRHFWWSTNDNCWVDVTT